MIKDATFANKIFMGKTRWKGEALSTGGLRQVIFEESMFSKMTHNLVFAGQPIRTATLPQHGNGAWLETCSC